LAAYHTLWFTVAVGEIPVPEELLLVQAWYERMSAFGHGRMREAVAEDAFTAARDKQPRPVPAGLVSSPKIGSRVAVRPEDYALDATAGVLVGVDQQRWIVARETPELGLLHVHFPRRGFELICRHGQRRSQR